MTIDLAWDDLHQREKDEIMEDIRTAYVYPHQLTCTSCTAFYPCKAITHIINLLNAMVFNET